MRASLGGGARPGRDGAHPARRADGGRSLPAAGARGLRRVLWVSGAVVANTPKYLIQNFQIRQEISIGRVILEAFKAM